MDIGIGWEFYDSQQDRLVATSLCEIYVSKKMDKNSVASIVSLLETALAHTKIKAIGSDLRNFPVQEVVQDIEDYTGNKVKVDLNIQHYGPKCFGEGCFDPTFLFSRLTNNKWSTFTYGVDGDLADLTKFLLD